MRNTGLPAFPPALLLAVLIGCQEGAATDGEAARERITAPRETPTAEDAANATYAGIYDESITLRQGRYEGEPLDPGGATIPTVGLFDELQLLADLDGDGANERSVLLWETAGGRGTSVYLALVRSVGEASATLVGDRVAIRALEVSGGLLQMEVLRAGDGDAVCCPGELATMRWRTSRDGLGLVSDEVDGRLGLSTVAGEWRLATKEAANDILMAGRILEGSEAAGDLRVIVADDDAALIAAGLDLEITLTINPDGTVAGRSGCNQYSGSARFEEPNSLGFGPLGMTLMACPESVMLLEQEYLSRLQAVTSVGFHVGKLALGWQTEDAHATLLFVPR